MASRRVPALLSGLFFHGHQAGPDHCSTHITTLLFVGRNQTNLSGGDKMSVRTRSHSPVILAMLAFALVLFAMAGLSVQTVTAEAKDDQVSIAGYELIGTVNIPTGTQFEDT